MTRRTPSLAAPLAALCAILLATSGVSGAPRSTQVGPSVNPPAPLRSGSSGKLPGVLSVPSRPDRPTDEPGGLLKGNPKAGVTNLLACDQFFITYSLVVEGEGPVRDVTGIATNAFACGGTDPWPVVGTFDIRHWRLHLRVTNPVPCYYQFYTFDGYGHGDCNCFEGRYCWNNDGVYDPMTLSACYK